MASNRSCAACDRLQEDNPDFVVNGITEEVCNSLKNNTGFSTQAGHDDCTDLNDANDCLIGNMEDEVDDYEVCGWKAFMEQFIYNLWTVLKAIICSICGLWTMVTSLIDNVQSYQLVRSGDNIILRADDGDHGSVAAADTNTRYQLHTKTYTKTNVNVSANDSYTLDMVCAKPEEFSEDLYPMAMAGWQMEGTGVSNCFTRYVQLTDRTTNSTHAKMILQNTGNSAATLTLNVEVLWWGLRS